MLTAAGPDEGNMPMTKGCSITSNNIPFVLYDDASFATSTACVPGAAAGVVQYAIVDD